jgi:hypothetical protein
MLTPLDASRRARLSLRFRIGILLLLSSAFLVGLVLLLDRGLVDPPVEARPAADGEPVGAAGNSPGVDPSTGERRPAATGVDGSLSTPAASPDPMPAPALRGLLLWADGSAATGLAYVWRDDGSVEYYHGVVDADGGFAVPGSLTEADGRKLRVHVSQFCMVEYAGLDVATPYTLHLPPVDELKVRVVSQVQRSLAEMRPRVYCALEPRDGMGRIPFVVPSHPDVAATFTIDLFPRAVPESGSAFALPVGPLYQIACVVYGGRIVPANQLGRVPAEVIFEVVEQLESPGLEAIDAGSVADVSGEVLVMRRDGASMSVDSFPLEHGVAHLTAARLRAMRDAGDGCVVTVLLLDGRMIEATPSRAGWDTERKRMQLDLGIALAPVIVDTAKSEDPRIVRSRLAGGLSFAVNTGASVGDPAESSFSRSGSTLRLHRLPEAWSEIDVVYRDGSAVVVERLLGAQVRVTSRLSERVLEVDFQAVVAPLVARHGQVQVKFEHRIRADAAIGASVVDMVSLRTPGECAGKVWRKQVVEGARAAIIAECAGGRIVLAE